MKKNLKEIDTYFIYGAVLHNIARIKSTLLKNVDFKFALDMRYNPVLGSYRRLREARGESEKYFLARTLRDTLGETCTVTILQRVGDVSSTALGGRKFVAALTKRIKGKGFAVEPGEYLVHETVRKQADIEVRV